MRDKGIKNNKLKKKNSKSKNYSARGLDLSRGYNPDILSPEQQQQPPNMMMVQQQQQQQLVQRGLSSATPTMQQRIKALGVATPLAMSSPVRRYVQFIIIHLFPFSFFFLGRNKSAAAPKHLARRI